jgi:hypothetical protein
MHCLHQLCILAGPPLTVTICINISEESLCQSSLVCRTAFLLQCCAGVLLWHTGHPTPCTTYLSFATIPATPTMFPILSMMNQHLQTTTLTFQDQCLQGDGCRDEHSLPNLTICSPPTSLAHFPCKPWLSRHNNTSSAMLSWGVTRPPTW